MKIITDREANGPNVIFCAAMGLIYLVCGTLAHDSALFAVANIWFAAGFIVRELKCN